MQKDRLRERVNAVYGYNAISRIHLTQTAPTGFAEGQAKFAPRHGTGRTSAGPGAWPRAPMKPPRASRITGLRAALERLGQNILTRRKAEKGKT